MLYDEGQGVPQDDKTAVKWWKLAAEQGNADAQNNLGFMNANGKGVPQDYILGHMWWNLAASTGFTPELKAGLGFTNGNSHPFFFPWLYLVQLLGLWTIKPGI